MRCSVLGAARSGIAVAKLLRSKGAAVFVSDQRPLEQLDEEALSLRSLGIGLEGGGHSDRVLECSLMVLSPGVPGDIPFVQEAGRRGIRVLSELEVASWFCRSPIVAVTGSNGKTTTTTLIGRILGDAKKKHVVAGNIGTAFSSVVLDMAEEDIVVLEVSSFQLDHCESFRPKVSVILNVTEDHMDRYRHSMELYAASKARIFMNQSDDDTFVYCADDPWTVRIAAQAKCRRLSFSTDTTLQEGAWTENGILMLGDQDGPKPVIPLDQMTIRGIHNARNAMAAVLVGSLFGVSIASMRATLRNFKGVEHRLEFVREHNGVRYYNDSKATNVDAVRYAIQAFSNPIILILGGRDKGNDYTVIQDLVRKHVKAILAIGESAQKVENAFRGIVPLHRASSMEEAVRLSAQVGRAGDVVLLSPACASFDWFKNYEHRGKVFKDLVNHL
jgi:UDP-N-acetylmuramoylalanine--D-glutamate ligase